MTRRRTLKKRRVREKRIKKRLRQRWTLPFECQICRFMVAQIPIVYDEPLSHEPMTICTDCSLELPRKSTVPIYKHDLRFHRVWTGKAAS